MAGHVMCLVEGHPLLHWRLRFNITLEAKQRQMDGFFSQLPYK